MTPWETLLEFIFAPFFFLLDAWRGFCGGDLTCAVITSPFLLAATVGGFYLSLWVIVGIYLVFSDLIKIIAHDVRWKETLEKKAVPGEFAFDFEIYSWNDDIKEEEIIKNPTFDEVKLQEPEFEFRSFLPDHKEPLSTTLTLKQNGLWSPDGWNGSPDDTNRRVVSTVHIAPTDRETSYTTTEIWHLRNCSRRQLRKEKEAGQVHRHGGRCKRIKSVKHVFWHIRKGQKTT
jgi:hypothetical protein